MSDSKILGEYCGQLNRNNLENMDYFLGKYRLIKIDLGRYRKIK